MIAPQRQQEPVREMQFTRLTCALSEQVWIEELLASRIEAPHLAFVEYKKPAFICGRRGGDEVAIKRRAEQLCFDHLRRRSGGSAVLAGPWMLGVELLLPDQHWLANRSLVESFRWFGRSFQAALREHGVASRLASPRGITEHNAAAQSAGLEWACFAGLGHGELLDTHGAKLVGLSQYRGSRGVLLSAGVMLATAPWEDFEWIYHGKRPARSQMHQLASEGPPNICALSVAASLADILREDLREPNFTFGH